MAKSAAVSAFLGLGSMAALGSSGLGFVVPQPSPLARQTAASQVTTLGGSIPSRAQADSSSASIGGAALLFGLAAVGGAGAALARRKPRSACEAVGLLYATQTGNTETVAGYIAEAAGIEAEDVGDYGAEDLLEFDGIIVGTPTWNTGADEYRSGVAWDDLIDDIKGLDMKGKKVAIFGCGDSEGYADNFCDGIEELNSTFKAAGADVIGYVDAGSYNHAESKSDQGGKFLGCPFDEDNQGDMSEDRAKEWVEQLKSEGMPF